MQIVLRYQKLSDEFIDKHCLSSEAKMVVICQYQCLGPELLRRMVCSSETSLDILEVIFQYQNLGDLIPDALRNVAERPVESDIQFECMENMFLCQKFGHTVFQQMLEITRPKMTETVERDLWISIFVRCISGSLGFSAEEMAPIVNLVDWHRVSNRRWNPAALAGLVSGYADKICWYSVLQNNALTETQIEDLAEHGHIGAIEWWAVLNQNYSKEFLTQHAEKSKWWRFISSSASGDLFRAGLENIKGIAPREQNYLLDFLINFAKKGDWLNILKDEPLPEWFIRLFQNFAEVIPMFWWKICRYQQLSETFIRFYIEKIDMAVILAYQLLSEEFLEEQCGFFDDDAWHRVAKYQTLSPAFREKYGEFLTMH